MKDSWSSRRQLRQLRGLGMVCAHLLVWPLAVAVSLGLMLAPARGQTSHRESQPVSTGKTSDELENSAEEPQLLREGTEIRDVSGTFFKQGDVAVFETQDGRQFSGLKNLNLQRIAKKLQDIEDPELLIWTVRGLITEFDGQNYLLIRRAVFRTAK